MFNSPELVQAAFGTILKPLVEQLERGLREGVFHDIDPSTDAEIVQGAVWACTQRQWATRNTVGADIRRQAIRACRAHWAPLPKRLPKSFPLEAIRKPAHDKLRQYRQQHQQKEARWTWG